MEYRQDQGRTRGMKRAKRAYHKAVRAVARGYGRETRIYKRIMPRPSGA
jgi:hypothetical protein